MASVPQDVEQTKNALVAKLAELNKLSGEAITAALDHFKALDHGDAPSDALAHLTDALADTFKTLAGVFATLNGTVAPAADVDPTASQDADADGKGKKPRKKRAPRDPDAPKKPVTLFFLYRDAVRDQLMKDNLTEDGVPMTNVEFTKLVSEKWMGEPEDVKAKYKEEYTQKWLQYQKELEAYKHKKALEAGDADADAPEVVEVEELVTEVAAPEDDDESAEEPKQEPAVETKEKKKKRKSEDKSKKTDDKPKKKSKKKKSEKSE